MAKTKETQHLEWMLWVKYIRNKLGIYGCFEVTFGNRDVWNKIHDAERVDFVTYENKNNVFRCFEIKVSKSDFNSTAKTTFYGDYNYYVMPEKLFDEVGHLIDWRVGVINSSGDVIRKPKKINVALHTKMMMAENMMKSLHREQTKLYKIKGYWE